MSNSFRSATRRLVKKQERAAAESIGGHVQKASGALPYAKSDAVANGKMRVECKLTRQNRFRLQFSVLDKIQLEALKGGLEDWALQLKFVRQGGISYDYAIIPLSAAIQLGWNTEAMPLVYSKGDSETIQSSTQPYIIRRSIKNYLYAVVWWSDFEDRRNKACSK